jgi:4-amino-4-deoxy-L-arabinose transferase-like glycosyltransferase
MTTLRQTIARFYLSATDPFLRHERRSLVILFLLALTLRLAYTSLFVGFASPPEYDGIGYNQLADGLLAGRGYVNYWSEPTAFRPPVYPIFLAGMYALTGHSFAVVRLVQAVLDSITVLLVYGVARQLFGARVALLAGLGTALYPLLIYETGLLLPETLSYSLQFTAILLLMLMLRKDHLALPFLAGLLIGLTVLARPTATLWVPLVALWIVLPGVMRRAPAKLTSMLVGLTLIFVPWILRNYLVFDTLIPISSNGAVNIWCGNNPLADGGSVQPSQETWNGPDYPTRGLLGWEGLSEVASNKQFSDQGWAWIRSNPDEFARLVPKKLLRLWSPVSYSVQSGRAPTRLMTTLAIPPYLVFLGLAGYGIFLARRQWRELFLLLSFIVSVNVLVVIYYGATRYGIPMGICLVIFAALGLDSILLRQRSV